ncbi:hypothetical protein [uncultured Clostridium sp.]|nr:hypothetical protein [uncultured Clostridium sp.]
MDINGIIREYAKKFSSAIDEVLEQAMKSAGITDIYNPNGTLKSVREY